jgi:hypothetical protein
MATSFTSTKMENQAMMILAMFFSRNGVGQVLVFFFEFSFSQKHVDTKTLYLTPTSS